MHKKGATFTMHKSNKHPCAVFFHTYKSLPFPRASLNSIVKTLYKKEKKLAGKEVNIILCSDSVIQRLNRKHRNKNRPTDVLSFPFNEPDFSGEIYISLERAAVQARRYKSTYTKELGRLLVHGFIHLAGFDHETEEERERMEAVERQYTGDQS